MLPVNAMNVSTKCDVAVAMCTGKPSRVAISGTCSTPPPMPRKLETKPTTTL